MIRLLELFQRPWALQAGYLEKAYDIVARHESGLRLSAEDIEAATATARGGSGPIDVGPRTALIMVQGVIAQHAALVNQISGPRGTSVESLRRQKNAAMESADVDQVLWYFDTPGGSVAGVDEFAEEIHAAGKIKPQIGYTDNLCASAGYWFMAACTKAYAQRTAELGSIGVYCVVDDLSVRAHNLGVKVHLVKAGANKGEFVSGVPVSPEALAALQEDVDQYYAFFTGAVSKFRGLSMDQTLAAANGRSFLAATALEKGLIDGIRTRAEMFELTSAPRAFTTGARPMEPKATDTPNPTQPTAPAAPAAPVPPAAPAATAPAVDPQAIAAAAVAQERERLAGLDALATAWPEHKAVIDQCRKDGTSESEANKLVLAAESKLKQARLASMRSGGQANEPLGGGNADTPTQDAFSVDAVKARFASDSAYAAKYRTEEKAIAWERARHEAKQQESRRQ